MVAFVIGFILGVVFMFIICGTALVIRDEKATSSINKIKREERNV